MFTRKDLVPPAVVDAPGVLTSLAAWIRGLQEKGALEISQARIYADQGIIFPATQVSSTDANTLDDYEEGTWTPVLTFATAGNQSIAYAKQYGDYTKVGREVCIRFHIETSTFTHTTASGALSITGAPFAATSATNFACPGPLVWQGITKAGYTDIVAYMTAGTATITLQASGSGVNTDDIDNGDAPTAGTVILRGQLSYRV